MVSFLHSADWQIGKPYARVQDPDKRARLRQVRIETISRIGAWIEAEQAAFLLVAGDLFDSPTPSASDVSAVCQAIGKLAIPVLVIPGNHDHGAPGSVWHTPFFQAEQQRRAPNLTVLLERTPLELEQAVLLPCPLLRRSDELSPTAWLQQLNWEALPAEKPRILLAHGSVQGFTAADLDADEENPASGSNRLQLDAGLLAKLDYIALGDWHGLTQVHPHCWYSGTPEPDRFPRHPDYQGGQVLAVQLERGQPAQVTPRPTAGLTWLPLQTDLNSLADVERLEQQLQQALGDEPGQQLLLLEASGRLNLQALERYQQLLERLEAQLLRLKRRGQVQQAPDAAELSSLTNRPADPLISRVAASLQQELEADGASADPQQQALLQLALAELHQCVGSSPCV